MVKEQTVQTRNLAIGMLQCGLTQQKVAKQIGVNIRTVRRWWLSFLEGHSLENKRGHGRKTSVPMPAKLVFTKSTKKRHQSTRSISRKLKSKGYSHTAPYTAIYGIPLTPRHIHAKGNPKKAPESLAILGLGMR